MFHVFQVLKNTEIFGTHEGSRYRKSNYEVPENRAWVLLLEGTRGMYGTAGISGIIAHINGRFFGFEVKTAVGKPTTLQEATIRKILAAGGTALVVRSVDEARTAISDSLQ